MSYIDNLNNVNIKNLLNALVAQSSDENPLDYFDKIYSSVNPIMIINAIESARELVRSESAKNKKAKDVAEVYVTLGGESLNQSLYTGIIGTLLWLPNYITDAAKQLGIDDRSIEICKSVLDRCSLPKVHDVQELTVDNQKIQIKPSSIKHYTAFLTSIVSWLNSGVSSFKINGVMKTNYELAKYLSSVALESFPSIPFGCYYVGSCKTTDTMKLTEKLGKAFNWLDYMTKESYVINEPKFVVTTDNAPVVGIIGHPLTETFAVQTEDGVSKWLGLFVETEEFSNLCAQHGITINELKKYIIVNTPEMHKANLQNKDNIAVFIENQKMTNEIFKLRHQFSSVDTSCLDENYDV